MTMDFQTVRDAIRDLLSSEAGSDFTVIGLQKPGKSPEDTDSGCLVEVFFSRGEWPKSSGSLYGPNRHDLTFQLTLTVSKASTVDTSVLDDPSSTAGELAIALAAMKESGAIADEALDDLYGKVYQILMSAENIDLGLEAGVVASRWVTQFVKDEPIESGNYTVITGSMMLTCTVSEQVSGETCTIIAPVYDVDLEINSDEAGKAGVIVEAT